ncbi:MAG TPA: 3-phosphoshikimate 1-carboxyvinyltransferase [Flavipsychrobacter sp.]|nr:3-phosphoshikimate 1-carboxyvinyltransferase [Flavipsychrobacter sp.]
MSTPIHIIIQPAFAEGTLSVPPSKSLMQRACAAALLNKGHTTLYNPGIADDDRAALRIIENLGARIETFSDGSLGIESEGIKPVSHSISCGESGLCARLFTPIAALSDQALTITGEGSLLERPMDFLAAVLTRLNVQLSDTYGRLPITVQGPLQPKDIHVDGSLSSQFLTGLLFAYAFAARQDVKIAVSRLASKPYIDLTLSVLEHFGKRIDNKEYSQFKIVPIEPERLNVAYTVEADWSSASYWVVAGLINGDIRLKGLNENSKQADRILLDVVKSCGGNFLFEENILHIHKTTSLQSFYFDATDAPDLFPALAVLAAGCRGSSAIKGLSRLKHKESNREESIRQLLNSFGVPNTIEGDCLIITGVQQFKSCTINSFLDHRIAMAASVGALKAEGEVMIRDTQCVSKSYPDFFKHLNQLGVNTTTVI